MVGGFDRVFEINRNFRNEGISIQHNPEFTMMEFYRAYATYLDLMNFTEEMICHVADKVCGGLVIPYAGKEVDLTPPWDRLTLKESIVKYGKVEMAVLEDPEQSFHYAKSLGLDLDARIGHGKLLAEIFDEVVEPNLLAADFYYRISDRDFAVVAKK